MLLNTSSDPSSRSTLISWPTYRKYHHLSCSLSSLRRFLIPLIRPSSISSNPTSRDLRHYWRRRRPYKDKRCDMGIGLSRIGMKRLMPKLVLFLIRSFRKRYEVLRESSSGILLNLGVRMCGSTMGQVTRCPSCTFVGLSID